jgi:hypothetical protein
MVVGLVIFLDGTGTLAPDELLLTIVHLLRQFRQERF